MSSPDSPKTHFTTRRGFIAAAGLGGLSLYGLWAAYGVAPRPLALLGLDGGGEHAGHGDADAHAGHGAAPSGGGHAGHGAAAAGPGTEEFRRMTEEFVERYRLPDGTVYPRRLAAAKPAAAAGHGDHAAHGVHGAQDEHGDHAAAKEAAPQQAEGHDHAAMLAEMAPIDVLMVAGQWFYLPAALRLDAGQAYRFRMMALDVAHGASIQLGQGSRMARLRPGSVTDIEMTFHAPGRHFMYCTVYCGQAHDLMQARIEVV